MKGRVRYSHGWIIGVDWDRFVKNPQKQGYYVEAFGAADAFIDYEIDSMFEQAHFNSETLPLVTALKELHKLGSMDMLETLVREGFVKKTLLERVQQFKRARNLVLHDKFAEYALVFYNKEIRVKNQTQLDKATVKEVTKSLTEAEKLFYEINRLGLTVSKPTSKP